MKHIIVIYATVLVCVHTNNTPQQVMVDVTNEFGVCVLQLVSSRIENVAFSPYGVVSVGLVLYEGASGTTAAEIHNTLRLPWNRHLTRIGFRDLHRYLKSYFTNDGFLRGLVLSKPNVILHWNYTRQLQFYGFDLKSTDTTSKVPSTTQTTPLEQTTKPVLTGIGTSTEIPTQQTTKPLLTNIGTSNEKPTQQTTKPLLTTVETSTEIPTQQNTKPSLTTVETSTEIPTQQNTKPSLTTVETSTEIPTQQNTTTPSSTTVETSITTQRTDAATTDAAMVPSISPLIENRDITIPDDQEAEQTSKAPLTEPTTAKIETNDEETQPTGEVSKPGSTIPTTTDSITADGNNQQTEEVISVRENETQKTEEAPKVTTDVANTQSEEKQTTPNVQISVSSQTETRTAGTISEASTLETTITDIGELDERFGIIETEVPTTEPLTQKTEITSVSTNSPSTSQTVMGNVPETTTTPLSVTMISQVTNEHKAESEATIVTSVPQPTETSASKRTKVVVNEATPDLTSAAQSEGTNTESQFPTEASTTLPQSTLTESVGTTSASTIPPSTNTETETTNEISTQHTMSEANGTPHDNEIARKRRALQRSKEHFQENREGISNWVPRYHDPRWMYHAPLENWFFSYFGFEKVPVITYTAYLPFAYIDDLATSALQVPLDDSRYYMLILLPQKRYALENLLISLQWCPIRAIINQLKLTAVFATVPVFTIVKHVNLVPALAKLGILSVFNPSTADLSAMSSEKGIFVRTIEQVVTVSLRRYMANQRVLEVQPDEVEHQFIANHPFAYFVIDKETDVVLMTGTIVNPIAYNQ